MFPSKKRKKIETLNICFAQILVCIYLIYYSWLVYAINKGEINMEV